MSYFGFLARFVLLPILLFALFNLWDGQRGKRLPAPLQGNSPLTLIGILIAIALLYTTPWDNYLVATRVWWYNPALVAGITLGWVPLEEYLFFVLQPILIGLWMLLLARRLPATSEKDNAGIRWLSAGIVGFIWLTSIISLFTRWQPATYLALELAWALPPIILQLFFGADILLRHWRLVLLTIVPMTLYLSAADTVAITGGTWTIDPAQSLGLFLGGHLPVEELIFFMLTTILVTFGLVLGIAAESWTRLTHFPSFKKTTRKQEPSGSLPGSV